LPLAGARAKPPPLSSALRVAIGDSPTLTTSLTIGTTRCGHLAFTRVIALRRGPLLDPTIGLHAGMNPVLLLVS
jgi:hypothetical protein